VCRCPPQNAETKVRQLVRVNSRRDSRHGSQLWRLQKRQRKGEPLKKGKILTIVDLPSSPVLSVFVESLFTFPTK
jgi:hypothetical protein